MRVAVIGYGLYGSFAAKSCAESGHDVTIFHNSQLDSYSTASTVNQARVHGGYHYPRSIVTAIESRSHREEFESFFKDALLPEYPQIYGIPKGMSLCSPDQFEKFCERAGAPLSVYSDDLITDRVEKCYITDERAIDTLKMMEIAHNALEKFSNVEIIQKPIFSISKEGENVIIDGREFDKVINCSYSSINSIHRKMDPDSHEIVRYENCVITLIKDSSKALGGRGYTFMDGPFCSIMPFTNDLYSLTSVSFTPQGDENSKAHEHIEKYMLKELSLYIKPEIVKQLEVYDKLSTIKAVPVSSEIDDSRSVVYRYVDNWGMTILGGKLTAVFEIIPRVRDFIDG